MKNKFVDFVENVAIGSIVATLISGLLFIKPILSIGMGWLTGSIIKWLFGIYMTDGLNLLFNTTRFEPNHIPMLCSTLAVIGSYFKSIQTNNE